MDEKKAKKGKRPSHIYVCFNVSDEHDDQTWDGPGSNSSGHLIVMKRL